MSTEIAIEKIEKITKALEEAKNVGIDISSLSNLVELLKQQQIICDPRSPYFDEDEEEEVYSFSEFLKMKMDKRNGKINDEEEEEEDEQTDYVYEFGKRKVILDDSEDEQNESSSSSSSRSSSKKSKKDKKEKEEKKDDVPDFLPISKIKNQKKFVIKGLVQSGKTEYMICLMLYMLTMNKSVVLVVRNIQDDRVQFSKRFSEFKKKYCDKFSELNSIDLIDNVLKKIKTDKKCSRIFLCLDNASNIKKVNEVLLKSGERYVTIFDEADFVDSGKGIKSKHYDTLKMRSSKIFWVSATIMDMLAKEDGISGENVIFLTPSDRKNYKGILNNRIVMETIPSGKYVGEVHEDLFDCNPYFDTFLDEYKMKSIFGNHPRICLVNVSHCIEPLEKAQKRIGEDHPELSVIVYNSPGLVYQKGSKRIFGEDIDCDDVSSFLQYLKTKDEHKGDTHIIILSGYMAGRGISFVSEDYKWHLTDEYLVMSKSADEPELIQKVRLQGIYKDDIPLTLYTTSDVRKDLLKASVRMEELTKACKDNIESECKKLLSEIPVMKEKFTKRDMTKNVVIKMNKVRQNIGWSTQIYQGKDFIPDEVLSEYGLSVLSSERDKFREENKYEDSDDLGVIDENLAKTIDDINKIMTGKKTKEAMFLSQIDPNKEYKKEEILEMIKEAGYQQPTSIFSSFTNPNTKYAHYMIEPVSNGMRWKIRDSLRVCWKS